MNKSRQNSTNLNPTQHFSSKVDRSQHSSTVVKAACMKCRRIISDRHTYWNIKGCGDASRVFIAKCLFFSAEGCGDFCKRCGTNVPPRENGGNCMAKPRTERNLLF